MAAARTQPLAAASGEITIAEPLARRSYAASIKRRNLLLELASSRSLSLSGLVSSPLSLSLSLFCSTRSADRVASLSLSSLSRGFLSLSSSLSMAAMQPALQRRASGGRAEA